MNYISENPKIIPYINQMIRVFKNDEEGAIDKLALLFFVLDSDDNKDWRKIEHLYDREGLSPEEKEAKRKRLYEVTGILYSVFRLVDNI